MYACVCVCMCTRTLSHSVMSDSESFWTVPYQAPLSMGVFRQGYWTGAGCNVILQGIFPTQGLKPSFLCLLHCRQVLDSLSHWGELGYTSSTTHPVLYPLLKSTNLKVKDPPCLFGTSLFIIPIKIIQQTMKEKEQNTWNFIRHEFIQTLVLLLWASNYLHNLLKIYQFG